MPRPKHIIDKECLNRLKIAIQIRVGVTVLNRPDCQRLSERLKNHFGIFISESTINRLYLGANESNHFYLDTLNQLVSIVFNSLTWNEYCQNYLSTKEASAELGFGLKINPKNTLLYQNFEHRNWNTLNAYFENIQSEEVNKDVNFIFHELGTQLYSLARYSQRHELQLYKQFAQNPTVRKAFFEYLADPEFRLPNYVKGLDIYGKHIDYNSVDAFNEYCFVLTMKYLHFTKTNKASNCKKLFDELAGQFPIHDLEKIKLHPFNLGRLFAAYIVTVIERGKDYLDILLHQIKQIVLNNADKWDAFSKRIIFYYLVYSLDFKRVSLEIIYEAESWFGLKFLDDDVQSSKSVIKFLREMEPNTLPWLHRFGLVKS
jgi:hypothetical protein